MWAPSRALRIARSIQTADFHASAALFKRRDGASGHIVKTPRVFKKELTKQQKKKAVISRGHVDHVTRMRQLKEQASFLANKEEAFMAFEQDEELTREYDLAYDELIDSGRYREYDFADVMDITLRDVDPEDIANDFYSLPHEQQTIDGLAEVMRAYAVHGRADATEALLSQLEYQQSGQTNAVTGVDVSAANSLVLSRGSLSPTLVPSERCYVYHICALAQNREAAKAVRVLGRMKERGMKPTQHSYNSVMQACTRARRPDWAYNIFEKMQAKGIRPSLITFTILMNSSIAVNDLDRAFETFHMMRTYVARPSLITFNSIIHGYAKAGRVERAINLLDDMLELRMTPCTITYNNLILACANSTYYAHKAWEFYYEMQDQYDHIPDVITYSNMLAACARHGDLRGAEKLVWDMNRRKVPQTPAISIQLINVYARAQIKQVVGKARSNIAPPEAVDPIIQERTEFDDEGNVIDLDRPFRRDVYSDDNMGYDQDDWEGEEDLDWDESGEVGTSGRVRGLTPAEREELERYLRPHQAKAKEEAEEEEALMAMDPDEVMRDMDPLKYNPVNLANFSQFQEENIAKGMELYNNALEQHGPSQKLLNAALSVYTNALRIQRAIDFVENEFPEHGVQQDIYTYKYLMRMFVNAKRTEQAEALVNEIADKGIQPDADFYGILVDYHARHKRLRSALERLEEMDRHGLKLPEKYSNVLHRLVQKYRVYTELLPEDPNAIHSMSHHGVTMMRKERARQIKENRLRNRKFYIPRRASE